MAKLLNFDGIVDKIQEILNKVRAPINKGIDKVLDIIIGLAKKVANQLGGNEGKNDVPGKKPSDGEIGEIISFTGGEENHRIWIDTNNGKPLLMMASSRGQVDRFLSRDDVKVLRKEFGIIL